MGLKACQFVIETAFLYGELEEEIWMKFLMDIQIISK
jgi:hypothetical protein